MAKLYTKKVWINDQTKLSAKNLNHIENGIEAIADAIDEIEVQGGAHIHLNKPILDATTAAFTTELKEKYDTVENKSEVAVSTEGTSKDAVQYITIDGTEYKLAGSDIKYQELSNISLDSLTATGIYAITNALDTPANTANKGTLVVTKLTDTVVEQDWKSTTNNAQRLYTIGSSSVDNGFKVNGVVVEQDNIILEPGQVYELQGNLHGKVTIGSSADVPAARTKIILNGVNIQSDSDYAIGYLPDAEELIVVLSPNSENYLVNAEVGEAADDDFGALHSANDLHIYGTGSLTIKNTKGHGIKGSDLVISGKPGICVEANHDAVHGGKLLKISGGTFVIKNAKDAFSSSEHGPAQDGKTIILGGTFTINACKEAAFDGKSTNGIKKILNANITLGADVTETFVSPNGFEIYETTTIINNSGKAVPDTVNLATKYAAPEITYLDGTEVKHVQEFDNRFTLNAGDPVSYKLSGNFSGKKVYILDNIKKVNIEFHGVYCVDDSEEPFIEYTYPDKSRVKIDCVEGTVNYINKSAGYAIKSSKNINIVGKGDLIANSVYAPYGDLLIKGDGARLIDTAYTNQLIAGADQEDIDSAAINALGKYKAQIYINNLLVNTRKNNECGKVVANQYLVGSCILGTVSDDYGIAENIIGYAGSRGEMAVIEDTVLIGNFINKPEVFCLANSLTKTDILVYETAEVIHTEIPSIDDTSSSPWTVYSGDGYSKAAADEKFVAKSVYDALVAELDTKSPKKISIINYVEDETKTDHRPAKTVAYSDGKIDAIEIFRYACPERIDIDSTVDANGDNVEEPETHLSYFKDGRTIYARDGDFGYPEIDGTGQFNFRPVFNSSYKTGYVLQPIVTDSEGNPHDDKNNPCYSNFKTPWLTGIDGLYRFTKVCKDIKVDMRAVLESGLPTNTITYKIIAPAGYDAAKIPNVRVFRCSDQVEKYYKYYLHPEKYEILDPELMKGQVLEFIKQETAEGEDQVWEAVGISYDDSTGYPSDNKAKVTFLIETSNLEEGYSATPSATGKFKNLNAGDFGPTKVLTSITGAVTVTIRVAPPVDVSYDDQGHTRADSKNKVLYGFDPEKTPASASQYSPFRFTIIHGKEYANSRIAEDGTKIVTKDDGSDFTAADAAALIDGITVGDKAVNVLESISITPLSFTKRKVTIELNGDIITGNVVIKLAAEAE